MEASIDMNNNTIYNVKDPVLADQATNKKYVDTQLVEKLDKGANIDMKNKSIINLKRQCPLRPSEIENMWHMMKNQNFPFFAQRYLMVALETWWHFLLRNYF